MLTKWEKLPDYIRVPEVRPYYDLLRKKRFSLLIKRLFDLLAALVLLAFLAIPMLVVAIWVKADSTGPVFYRQERVTKDGKRFRIHKFRTMVVGADQIGSAVTVGNDKRVSSAQGLRQSNMWSAIFQNTMRRFCSLRESPARRASATKTRTGFSARRLTLTVYILKRYFRKK